MFFAVLIANKIFHFIVLLLVYFCDQFVVSEIRHSRRHCSVLSTINMEFSDEYKILIFKKQIHSAYAVTRVEELKPAHLKCNLFAFSSISGIISEYLQKI